MNAEYMGEKSSEIVGLGHEPGVPLLTVVLPSPLAASAGPLASAEASATPASARSLKRPVTHAWSELRQFLWAQVSSDTSMHCSQPVEV
jgi:hypothetical protein